LENFPFRAIGDRQRKVIEDTCNALNSGCKHIILEAPTGFGIHTTSYDQLYFIKENISDQNARRLTVTDPEMERDVVIKEHRESPKPTVLISPSLHAGLDLKDNLSRFQVITKVPYPNTADRWTAAKRNNNEEWYYLQTALKLVQAYGRSVRSKEDWAKTYILDAAFGYFVRKNRKFLPDWFMSGIK
jgi:ATP-dependent DNA helicase DinG